MRLLACLAVLLLALPPGGHAALAPGRAPPPALAPSLPLPQPTFERALASGHAPTPRALPALAQALARERGGAAPSPTSGLVGTIEEDLPWGDVSGDGRADVLALRQDEATGAWSAQGVRGTDGATLWTTPFGTPDAFGAAPLGDATGDGRADLLVETFTLDGVAPLGACFELCVGETQWRYHWTVELVSGADGSVAWTRTFPGAETDVVAGTESWTATNATVLAFGDAAAGVVVDAYDATDVAGALLVSSHGTLLDGAGVPRVARSDATSPDFAILLPAGRGAVEWERDANVFLAQTSLDLELLDGATSAIRWRASFPANGTSFTEPALADLAGDGADDVFVVDQGAADASGLLSGAVGKLLWRGVPGDPFVAGGGIAFAVLVTNDGSDDHFEVRRVEAATGRVLLTTQPYLGEQADSTTRLAIEGDADGDGVRDLVLNHLYNEVGYNSSALVESGRTGAQLYREDAPGIWSLAPAGDALASGSDAFHRVEVDFHYDDDGDLVQVDLRDEARTLASPLWWRNESFPNLPGLEIIAGPDMAGGAGADTIENVADAANGTASSREVLLDGATGAVEWTRGQLPY